MSAARTAVLLSPVVEDGGVETISNGPVVTVYIVRLNGRPVRFTCGFELVEQDLDASAFASEEDAALFIKENRHLKGKRGIAVVAKPLFRQRRVS